MATTMTTTTISVMQNPQDYLIQRAMEISAKLADLEPMPDLDQDDNNVSPATCDGDDDDDDATSTTDEDTASEASATAAKRRTHKSSSSSSQQKRKKIPDKTKQTAATTTTTTATRKKKSVGFARNIKDGKIKCTTHCYPQQQQLESGSVSVNELWYSPSEIQAIHAASQEDVAFHQENSPDYIAAIAGLAYYSFEKAVGSKENIKKKVQWGKEITKQGESGARGLEPSIVQRTQSWRAAHVDTVLNTQDELEKKGLLLGGGGRNTSSSSSSSKGLEMLRRKSRESSRPSRQLALMLAEHDTFEAMKATLLPWK